MFHLRFLPIDAARTPGQLLRLLAISALLLCGLTWTLWGGQTVFPQVPFADWLTSAPLWWDTILRLVMCGALLATAGLPAGTRAARRSVLIAAAAMSALILLDQHRLQPWAWQFLILAVLIGTATADRALVMARLFVVSIYAWSAWSKIDVGFTAEHGRYLLDGLLAPLGRSTRWWSAESVQYAAMLMPGGELLTALLLAVPQVRRAGIALSIVMHSALLVALGPWGHQHEPAVLVWNGYFILQNLLLFGVRIPSSAEVANPEHAASPLPPIEPEPQPPASDTVAPADVRPHVGQSPALAHIGPLIAWGAILLPLLEPWGLFDKWPSWSVYSARTPHMVLFVNREAEHRFPPEWQSALQPAGPQMPGMLRFRYERVSLEQLGAPVYPEIRYVCGVTLAVATRHQLGDGVTLIVEVPASRWTRQTRHSSFHGVKAIRRECSRFFLNALPRTGNFILEDPVPHASMQ